MWRGKQVRIAQGGPPPTTFSGSRVHWHWETTRKEKSVKLVKRLSKQIENTWPFKIQLVELRILLNIANENEPFALFVRKPMVGPALQEGGAPLPPRNGPRPGE